MARRITLADLEQVVRVINTKFDYALEPYGKSESGEFKPNPNVYLLDGAYGGYALNQMGSEGTGERHVIGRGTKRELYYQLVAFADGIDAARGK